MSSLLPEQQATKASSDLTSADRSLIEKLFSNPLVLPAIFKQWLVSYIGAEATITESQIVQVVGGAAPTGAVSAYAGSAAPSGWLLCDGTAVSRTTYADLYAQIATSYGVGDGSTTFNLPDLRGRAPVGLASGGKAAVDTLGDNEGISDQTKRSPSHYHRMGDSGNTVVGGGGGQSVASPPGDAPDYTTGDTDNLNSPAYLVVNFIIKT